MNISEKLRRPLTETKYLTAENYQRYRVIIRYFYLQYEQTNYRLYQEEVYEALTAHDLFLDYTPEQCKQDLEALRQWNNLRTIQDTRHVTTIEAFKNKNYRYELTEYTVEIERMTLRLENILEEGSSLEPTLLERLRKQLLETQTIWEEDNKTVYAWWDGVKNDFIRLNQNYKDYIRDISGIKAEEMMKTREFLLFKERLIEYLRTFIKGLQENAGMIEKSLKKTSQSMVEVILNKVVDYEMTIPRIDREPQRDFLYEQALGNWNSIKNWFIENSSGPSEANRLYDTTSETIRKITRYAIQIGELYRSGANRRGEYEKILEMFGRCETLNEAHELSALVFGIEKPLHFKGDFPRETDSSNSGVFDEKAWCVELKPRIRVYREKSKPTGIRDYSAQKKAMEMEMLKKIKEESLLISHYISDDCIDFNRLPKIKAAVRKTLLGWLSKALENPGKTSKTEEGISYFIEVSKNNEKCTVSCDDGDFIMPAFKIKFLKNSGEDL